MTTPSDIQEIPTYLTINSDINGINLNLNINININSSVKKHKNS